MRVPRILVVEDDLAEGVLLAERLKKMRYEVVGPLRKGEEALEEIGLRRPDLVLMDIILAGEMDGINAANRIRSNFGVPVLFLTAFADKGLVELAKGSEPFGYLTKPYGQQQLGAAIEVALYKAEMDSRLRESEGRFRGITENTTDVTAVLNEQGMFTYVSPAITRFFGYSSDEVLGRSAEEFVHVEDWQLVESLMRQTLISPGETYSVEDFRFRKLDGEWVHLEGRIVSLPDTPGIWGTVLNCRDISERKKAQEQLIQAEKHKAVADLAAGVAHNFNNLLQIVQGNADLALLRLRQGRFTSIHALLEKISENCTLGAETVARLNGFARFQKADEISELESFDLTPMVVLVVEMTRHWWKTEPAEKGLTISVYTSLNDGCMVRGKKNELFEVLVNLIKNAVAALIHGGRIDIKTVLDEDWVVLTVKDTGIGIARENLSRVFTPFFSTSVQMGRGLGLATVRSIVDAHGGRIHSESEEGIGSTFTIMLPLASK